MRGVLAVQSREAEGPAGPKIRGGNPMSMVRLAAAAALAVSVALPAAAQGIPKAQSPEEVGFLAGEFTPRRIGWSSTAPARWASARSSSSRSATAFMSGTLLRRRLRKW
ncbi:MAG TPA: hypothetical protein VK552_20245, partial [Reyranella sp.]|nr:hypothetical protein [Reyranella sp.]